MEQYMVRIIDNNSRKVKKDLYLTARNTDTLRKRLIKDVLNDDVVLNVYKVLIDRNEFLGSMWQVGEYVSYRVNDSARPNWNGNQHPVNRKTGKFMR